MSGVFASVKGLQTFRPYAEYSDSKIPWVGRMPAHWQSARTKFVARLESGHTPSRQHPEYWANCTLPWFGLADVWQIRDGKTDYVTETKEKVSELGLANSSARKLPAGTVILSRTASVGFSAIMGCEMATTQDFANWVCTSKILPKYLLYVLRAMKPEFKRLTMGSTHQTIYMPDIGKFCTVLPPTDEQRTIAEFLDRETGKIDALVAKKERLIELLQEKRTALITHAVTKGLDPTAPTKPSGIDWLGDIPAHWEVKRWRYSCRISEGQVDPKDEEFGDRVLIAPNHIESGTGRILYLETAHEQGAISGKYVVRSGSLIYSKIRPALNKLCIAEGEWLCSADMYPIKTTNTDLSVQYLKYFMLSDPFVRLMVDESMRVAMPKVNRETLSATFVLCPPIENQSEIIEVLDTKTAGLDALISMVRTAVDHFRALRTVLISAAVTGKIDVREEVA